MYNNLKADGVETICIDEALTSCKESFTNNGIDREACFEGVESEEENRWHFYCCPRALLEG